MADHSWNESLASCSGHDRHNSLDTELSSHPVLHPTNSMNIPTGTGTGTAIVSYPYRTASNRCIRACSIILRISCIHVINHHGIDHSNRLKGELDTDSEVNTHLNVMKMRRQLELKGCQTKHQTRFYTTHAPLPNSPYVLYYSIKIPLHACTTIFSYSSTGMVRFSAK